MVEKLYEAITEKNIHIAEIMKVFGEDYWYVQKEILVLNGMRDAFEVIAGHSYTDHLLAKVDKTLAQIA